MDENEEMFRKEIEGLSERTKSILAQEIQKSGREKNSMYFLYRKSFTNELSTGSIIFSDATTSNILLIALLPLKVCMFPIKINFDFARVIATSAALYLLVALSYLFEGIVFHE